MLFPIESLRYIIQDIYQSAISPLCISSISSECCLLYERLSLNWTGSVSDYSDGNDNVELK